MRPRSPGLLSGLIRDPLIATNVPCPLVRLVSPPPPTTSSSSSNAGRVVPGRPPATPKPIAEDGNLSSGSLGSGRISHKRHVAGGAGGGGGSGELHGVAADASPANTALPSASSSVAVSNSGAAGVTVESADGASGGAGLVLWSAGALARGGGAGGGGGGVGGSSRSFTPVVGVGPSSSSRRLATPQEGGRQVWTAFMCLAGRGFHGRNRLCC